MKKMMMSIIAIVALTVTASPQNPEGKWLDMGKESSQYMYFGDSKDIDTLLLEDYEVTTTHEICASVHGYFLKKQQQGRYNVNFKGMRTQATFTFTTQHDAEAWVTKFCTAQSLTGIKSGRTDLARKY